MITTPKWGHPQNEDDLKNGDDLKNEDDLQNEGNQKKEDDLNKNEITFLWGDRNWDLKVSRKCWESLEKALRKSIRYRRMPSVYFKYAWHMPEICLNFVCDMPMPKICLIRYPLDKHDKWLRYAWDIPEIYMRYIWAMPEMSCKSKDMDEVLLRSVWYLQEICLRYA